MSYTLADPSWAWLLNPLQANVGYYGDSVAIQVAELNQHSCWGNPAFQHGWAASWLGVLLVHWVR